MKRADKYIRWLTVAALMLSVSAANLRVACGCAAAAGTTCTSRMSPDEMAPICCCAELGDGECCENCCCSEGESPSDKPIAPPTRTSSDESVVVAASPAVDQVAFAADGLTGAVHDGRMSTDGSLAVPSLQSQHVRIQT